MHAKFFRSLVVKMSVIAVVCTVYNTWCTFGWLRCTLNVVELFILFTRCENYADHSVLFLCTCWKNIIMSLYNCLLFRSFDVLFFVCFVNSKNKSRLNQKLLIGIDNPLYLLSTTVNYRFLIFIRLRQSLCRPVHHSLSEMRITVQMVDFEFMRIRENVTIDNCQAVFVSSAAVLLSRLPV